MDLYIDTANIEEIKEIESWGVLAGVTTNPSLIAKEGRDFKEVIGEISQIVDGPISAEVISTDSEGMLREARDLSKIDENVIIKIPMTDEGLKAVSILKQERIRTNVTLVFTVSQALLAARSGATYVSPFIGRLDDVGIDGLSLVSDIRKVFSNYNIKTKIIAASIRNVNHVKEVALLGSDIATIPYTTFKAMVKHELTDVGIERFLKDWESVR